METEQLKAAAAAMAAEITNDIGEKYKVGDDFHAVPNTALNIFDEKFFSVAGVTHEEMGEFVFELHHSPSFAYLMLHVPPLSLHASSFLNGFMFACFLIRMRDSGVDIEEMDQDLLVKDFNEWIDDLPDFKSEEAVTSTKKEEDDQEPPDDSDLDDSPAF